MKTSIAMFLILLIGLNPDRVFGMAGDAHVESGLDLLQHAPEQGGSKGMTPEKVKVIHDWMDVPANQTGEYINQKAGELLRPGNHGYLRHNPASVSRALSGTGEIDPTIMNQARLHKMQDIAHNSSPVDGWEPTARLKKQAEQILRGVEKSGRLPGKLPAWVDKSGSLIIKPSQAEAGRRFTSITEFIEPGRIPLLDDTELDRLRRSLAIPTERKAASQMCQVLCRTGRIVERIAVPVAIGVEIVALGNRVREAERLYAAGQISDYDRGRRHYAAVGSSAGGSGGAILGGIAGSAFGLPGTIVGVVFGGVAGDALGGKIGEAAWGIYWLAAEQERAWQRQSWSGYFAASGDSTLTVEELRKAGFGDVECQGFADYLSQKQATADTREGD
jgi:hypothetical protein